MKVVWGRRAKLDLRELTAYIAEDSVQGAELVAERIVRFANLVGRERVIAATDCGFLGFCQSQNSLGYPPSDRIWDPFYKLSIEANVPVLLMTGLTGIGQGMPGGMGVVLEDGHPRHVDIVAARFPELKILAGRPAWPWQDDMIAILLHKANVQYEVHGWSPKYFTPALKKEIGGRLQDRILFGWDWPTLTHERLVDDWRSLGYAEEVYEKVFYRNSEAFFPGAAPA